METPGRRRLRLLVMSCATAAPTPPADNPVPLSSPGLLPAYSCCTLTTTSRRRSLKKSYLNCRRNILAPVRVQTLTSSQYLMGRFPGEGRWWVRGDCPQFQMGENSLWYQRRDRSEFRGWGGSGNRRGGCRRLLQRVICTSEKQLWLSEYYRSDIHQLKYITYYLLAHNLLYYEKQTFKSLLIFTTKFYLRLIIIILTA